MRKTPNGRTLFMKAAEWEERDPNPNACGVEVVPKTLIPNHQDCFLRSLMNELWQLGIRPDDIGTAGHLAATQANLNEVSAILQAVMRSNSDKDATIASALNRTLSALELTGIK